MWQASKDGIFGGRKCLVLVGWAGRFTLSSSQNWSERQLQGVSFNLVIRIISFTKDKRKLGLASICVPWYMWYFFWSYIFSKHQPFGSMLSISRNVRLSVCLCVRVSVCSLLRYRLNVFLPPFPAVRCPIFLEIRNPWGKVMERSGLLFEHFCLIIVKNRHAKKSFFWLILPYKTWWKPHFPMD